MKINEVAGFEQVPDKLYKRYRNHTFGLLFQVTNTVHELTNFGIEWLLYIH